MKKPSDVFKSIRYAKMEPQHDKGHAGGSTDDEEHGAIGEKEWAEQLKHAKKRAMMNTEAVKDKFDIGEYDQEGDMAKSDLRSIIANAQKMHDMIDDADNLPEWVQSKITKAEDYISTVANYMNSEMSEEVKDEYARKVDKYLKKKYNKEEVEQIDELSRGTLLSYANKVSLDSQKHSKDPTKRSGEKASRSVTGYARAHDRLEKPVKEEVEHLEEGRPSQRHPLEGHEYHKKTNAELEYIAKDAHKAAEAMKSHNTTAENKYRDQANDSATVRYYRQKNGMADWYKKKYGHMKEEMVSEENPPFDGPYKKTVGTVTDKSGAKHTPMSRARDLARNAALKQAQSMKQKEGMKKESLDESRKGDIVKEAFKKAKKKNDETFQSEPELGSSVVKSDN